MTDLSPAAQAVRDAVLATYADNIPKNDSLWNLERASTVAALRAAADQLYDSPSQDYLWGIAAELDGTQPTAQPEPEVEATPNDNDAWFHELVSEIARVQHVASGEGQAPRLDLAEAVVRWCRPTPQPPADGEVAASLIELRSTVMSLGRMRMFVAVQRIERAAELLQRQHPQPVPVSERLPEPSVKVLAHYFNALGKGRTICAIWVPAKSRSDEGDLDANDFLEYDEDGDKYYWPEGWYEAIENWEELGWAKVYEGEITHWQPLPQWPANALPTPEATNG